MIPASRSPPGCQVFAVVFSVIVLVEIGRTQFSEQAGSLSVDELVTRPRRGDETKVKILEFVIFCERPQIRVEFLGPEVVIFCAAQPVPLVLFALALAIVVLSLQIKAVILGPGLKLSG